MTRFEELFLPHLNAAYNLARWLTDNDSAAQDVVQESAYRAVKFLHRFDGGNPKAWFLTIVRNESYNWLKASSRHGTVVFDEAGLEDEPALSDGRTPEWQLIQGQEVERLQQALLALAPAFREVIVLKELEDMAYKDIARIVDIPLGTVMSRLARARAMLRLQLQKSCSS
ncbi:sigma-70 family RNA polymerase sigma factor [Pseudomonas sp. Fl5BN2]|uniref:sigma-70 family RNA polymerase sigma factor n=1 Tax=unclassified Pseudomonas TaxID=196821 RepID=UPI00137887E5|nr:MULTISPECIES: sigma-70 family RNA polymerase sigma factor [unclassified Pseudomonas]NBF01484.1 sigma-70 family RNA polymerase sigma factor [Pseudomonas sp. Fl5BN2]NBF08374.1 sigma-70 family RNA polymerase sigma factor [Pseudomonas sp. Fl4BN1]